MREITCAVCGNRERRLAYPSTISTAHVVQSRLDPYSAHDQINMLRPLKSAIPSDSWQTKMPGMASKRAGRHILERMGLSHTPLTVPPGNIGIVARRPLART
jgi:hypothetical protein